MVGSLFQTVSEFHPTELYILSKLEYDGITLGNHEFDFGPESLGRMIASSIFHGFRPNLLLANIKFSTLEEDDVLQHLYESGYIKPYRIVEKKGIKFGLFGIMGNRAGSLAMDYYPIEFPDAIETSKNVVSELQKQGADIIICLSHGGIYKKIIIGWEVTQSSQKRFQV